MHHLNIILSSIGVLVLALGLASRPLQRSPFPPTLLALLAGIVLGPAVTDLIDLSELGNRSSIVEGAARVTLAIGLFGVALRVPRAFPRRHAKRLAAFIPAAMLLMWAVSAALVLLVLGLPLWLAALVGAIITATDPIAATPIVTGGEAERHIPEDLRHATSFESGANDGLAYLFVFLPFLLHTMATPGEATVHWLVRTLLYDVGAATAVGLACGWAAGRLLQAAERRDLVEPKWRLVYTVAVALAVAGGGKLIGSDELLVVFAAGFAFVQVVSEDDRANEEQGQEAVNRFFSIPIFALLGLAIPWDGWMHLGAPGLLLAALVLLLRRPPVLLMLRRWMPGATGSREALFAGWFGPIAVAALYYAAMMGHKLSEPRIWDVVSLVVCASVVAHGMSAAPLTRWLGRARARRSDAAADGSTGPRPAD